MGLLDFIQNIMLLSLYFNEVLMLDCIFKIHVIL